MRKGGLKMSNIALILAGGIGSRMNQDIPKQFMTIEDRPLIIYTLQKFQNHPEIDAIAATCLKGWEETLRNYAKQFEITKLKYITLGGDTGFFSTYNGILELEKYFSPEDVVLIHSGNRPIISREIISDCISKAKIYDCCIGAFRGDTEEIMYSEDGKTSSKYYQRENMIITSPPTGIRLGKAVNLYKSAEKAGIKNAYTAATLMQDMGGTIHFSLGSRSNIKITYPKDIDLFKVLLKLPEGNE